MKIKKLLCLIVILGIFFICRNVYAASANISINKSNAYVGDSVTVTVSYNAATWNLHLSGSVNDSEVGYNMDGVNQSGSRSWSINTSTPGTYTVTLSGDITDQNDTNSNASGSVSVTVTEKPQEPEPQEPTTIVVKPSNNNNNNNKNDKNDTKTETAKSKNTKVKEISVDGYKLTKIDDNNYTLSVENEVDKIKVKVVAEDTKATVSGAGEKELEVGENKIEITITAEDGSTNKITIKVTRKEEEVITEPVIEIDDDVETPEPKNKINIISIIMIALNVILAISVIVLYRKNKKLKESIKK